MIKYWIVKSSIIFIYELLYVFYYPLSIICDLWSVIYDLWCLIYCLLIVNSYFLMTVIHYMICMISPHHTTPQHTTPPHTPHTPTPHHHTHTPTPPHPNETRRDETTTATPPWQEILPPPHPWRGAPNDATPPNRQIPPNRRADPPDNCPTTPRRTPQPSALNIWNNKAFLWFSMSNDYRFPQMFDFLFYFRCSIRITAVSGRKMTPKKLACPTDA